MGLGFGHCNVNDGGVLDGVIALLSTLDGIGIQIYTFYKYLGPVGDLF